MAKTKKKIAIIVCIAAVMILAAATFYIRLSGGAHTGIGNNPEADVRGSSNVLAAYFSWSGNTQQMAKWIAQETGGELFRIVPAEGYGEDYKACADRALSILGTDASDSERKVKEWAASFGNSGETSGGSMANGNGNSLSKTVPDGTFRFANNETDGNLAFLEREGYAHDGTASDEYTYNGLRFFWNKENK